MIALQSHDTDLRRHCLATICNITALSDVEATSLKDSEERKKWMGICASVLKMATESKEKDFSLAAQALSALQNLTLGLVPGENDSVPSKTSQPAVAEEEGEDDEWGK